MPAKKKKVSPKVQLAKVKKLESQLHKAHKELVKETRAVLKSAMRIEALASGKVSKMTMNRAQKVMKLLHGR